jgi:hypothetical protein
MRTHVLREFLQRTEIGAAVQILDEIQSRGRRGGPPFDVAMLTLARVLTHGELDYEFQGRLYAEAREAGLEDLMQLFFSSREERAPALPRDERQRELTLGHRKWQARDTRREVLDKLLRDPEAEVMPNLLQNPRITEGDVVRLAARRPIDPEVLRQIFAHPKWIKRYPVKRTLVLNPHTPSELSIRLLRLLNRSDLRLVRSMGTLPEVVQREAQRLLDRD